MAGRIISNPARVLAYINRHYALPAKAHMKGLGWEEDGQLVAGVIYEGFNGHNVWMHVAAEPGGRWMRREYLRYCFEYPFNEMGVSRVSGYLAASNTQAVRFDEHLGFHKEAVLTGAASDGGDIHIYVMRREDCRFLKEGTSNGR